jgi:hypothetical protein
MNVGRLWHHRQRGGVQRAKGLGAAMKQIAHGASRDGNAEAAICLLEPVLGKRVVTLVDDKVRDEARGVPRFIADTARRRCELRRIGEGLE